MPKNGNALKEYREKLARGEVEKSEKKDPVERSHADPKSLRKAINGKCWDCTCEQITEIRNCNIKTCCLWHVRPYQKKN